MLLRVRTSSLIFSALCGASFAAPTAAKTMNTSPKPKMNCGTTALAKSACMLNLALEDVRATYHHVGGGGITEIKSIATDVYRVSISQEERIDYITYEFEFKSNGDLRISKRTESNKSMRSP